MHSLRTWARRQYLTHELPDLFLGFLLAQMAALAAYLCVMAAVRGDFLGAWVASQTGLLLGLGAYGMWFTLSGSERRRRDAEQKASV